MMVKSYLIYAVCLYLAPSLILSVDYCFFICNGMTTCKYNVLGTGDYETSDGVLDIDLRKTFFLSVYFISLAAFKFFNYIFILFLFCVCLCIRSLGYLCRSSQIAKESYRMYLIYSIVLHSLHI